MSFKDLPQSAQKKTAEEHNADLIPAKMYTATCYSIIDLGTQAGSVMYPEPKRKVLLTFEIPSLMKVFDEEKGEQPKVIGKEYTLSFGEKANLSKDLLSWFSGDQPAGDMQAWLDDVVGRSAMINVAHKDAKQIREGDKIVRKYANIVSINPLPDEMEKPDQLNPSIVFDMAGEFNQTEFDKIPNWIQEKIKLSPEYENFETPKEEPTEEQKNDAEDLPF